MVVSFVVTVVNLVVVGFVVVIVGFCIVLVVGLTVVVFWFVRLCSGLVQDSFKNCMP